VKRPTLLNDHISFEADVRAPTGGPGRGFRRAPRQAGRWLINCCCVIAAALLPMMLAVLEIAVTGQDARSPAASSRLLAIDVVAADGPHRLIPLANVLQLTDATGWAVIVGSAGLAGAFCCVIVLVLNYMAKLNLVEVLKGNVPLSPRWFYVLALGVILGAVVALTWRLLTNGGWPGLQV